MAKVGGSCRLRRALVGIFAALLLIPFACEPDPVSNRSAAAEDRPPNVVMVIVDTLRADKLGCYGYPYDVTPELDRIAAQGVLFSHVVAQSSWTRPSIASMLTSLYPRSLGIYDEREDTLADEFLTLAEILRSHGYRTVGMTSNPNINSSFNFQQGFDEYSDSLVLFQWMEEEQGKTRSSDRELRSAREMFGELLRLARSDGDRPHYVQITIMEMHEYYKQSDHTLLRPEFRKLFPQQRDRPYLQSLRQSSKDIGELVDRLTAVKGWEDTLFVLVSDHGEGLGDHPGVWRSRWHGRQLYETQIMVPLILHRPGGKLPARRVDQRVRLMDLVPTLLDYLELPVPGQLQGVSLLGLILDRAPAPELPEHFVVETQFRGTDKIGIYTPRWKYLEHRDVDTIGRERGGEGVSPVELQAVGVKENGAATNMLEQHAAEALPLRESLERWEAKHPRRPPTPRGSALTTAEREQLRSLGYVD